MCLKYHRKAYVVLYLKIIFTKQKGWGDILSTNQKSDKKISEKIICVILLLVVVAFFALVVYINFLQNPIFYCTDMYSDMCFAQQVWKHKSIFPDGWVFGNQLYAVATPVVASVFFGITNNHTLAMAIASSIMALLILLSFVWMIKPMCKNRSSCLAGLVVLLALPLFLNNPISDINGWQLLYTMCSYYACYVITALLSFGCYLRYHSEVSLCTKILLIVALILSFGCGIQSLRQTVVMILPLLTLEFFSMIVRLKRKQKLFQPETIVVILMSVTNVIGLINSRLLHVPQHEIFDEIRVKTITQILSSIIPSFLDVFAIIRLNVILVIVISFAAISITAVLLIRYKKSLNMEIKCFLLFVFSIAFIFAIFVLTTMAFRIIYYFMIYPLVSLIVFIILDNSKKTARFSLTAIVLCFSIVCFAFGIKAVQTFNKLPQLTDTCKYLLEQDIDTIYTCWNFGEKVSIESDFKIKSGFWDYQDTMFEEIDYLCNSDIYDSNPKHSAYLFAKEDDVLVAEREARNMGVDLTFMKYISEDKIWIYTSPVSLMHKAENIQNQK